MGRKHLQDEMMQGCHTAEHLQGKGENEINSGGVFFIFSKMPSSDVWTFSRLIVKLAHFVKNNFAFRKSLSYYKLSLPS